MNQEPIIAKKTLADHGAGCCFANCGILAYVDKTGRVVKVEPNYEHPISRGYLCPERFPSPDKNTLIRYLYHPAQLLHPLKRVGARGEGKWKQITWDQAMNEIALKLQGLKDRYGAETLVVAEGTGRSDVFWARARFLNLFQNPSNVIDPGTICLCNGFAMQLAMVGNQLALSDYNLTKCVLLFGRDINESFPIQMRFVRIRREKRDPFRIIAVDSRFTESARIADIWLQIRPGSDGALLMSWINTIVKENLYDRDFVENWTNAQLLVRVDDGKQTILTEHDVVIGGSRERFAAWDSSRNKISIWDPETYKYSLPDSKPVLEGTYVIELSNGVKATCKTTWQLLKERVEKCTPEWAESITWIPAEKIVESARMYATNRPGCIFWGVATDQIGRNGTRVQQMRIILRALTGSINARAGDLEADIGPRNPETGELFRRDSLLQMDEVLNPNAKKKQLGANRFKLMTWPAFDITNPFYQKTYGIRRCMSSHFFLSPAPLAWRAILEEKPYPVKAMITWAANPLIWAANTPLVYKALKSPNLELHVVTEHVMTPTAQLADYVLPIASKVFERMWCTTKQDTANAVYAHDKVIEPLGERRSDYYFWRELAVRIGFKEHFPWKTDDEAQNMRMKPLGITVQELGDKGGILFHFPAERAHATPHPTMDGRPRGFATPSGKIEMYSIVLEMLDYDPLPYYEEPTESPISTPVLAKEYPLILTTGGRFRPMFHSEYRHFGMGTREIHPDPLMDIHIDTARDLGIAEGDWVWVETKRGRIKQKARVSPAIHPKVVNVEASWWFPERPGEEPHLYGIWESLSNILTLDDPNTLDSLTGGWTNRALLCKIYKV